MVKARYIFAIDQEVMHLKLNGQQCEIMNQRQSNGFNRETEDCRGFKKITWSNIENMTREKDGEREIEKNVHDVCRWIQDMKNVLYVLRIRFESNTHNSRTNR